MQSLVWFLLREQVTAKTALINKFPPKRMSGAMICAVSPFSHHDVKNNIEIVGVKAEVAQ